MLKSINTAIYATNTILVSKQSITYKDISYRVETYDDSSITIKAHYISNYNNTLKNFDIITIEMPIATYNLIILFIRSEKLQFTRTEQHIIKQSNPYYNLLKEN